MTSRYRAWWMAALAVVLLFGLVTPASADTPYFQIDYYYGGGGHTVYTTYSQYDWIANATTGDRRAEAQVSGVVKMVMTAEATDLGMSVTATFTMGSDGQNHIGTYSDGRQGSAHWEEWNYNLDCSLRGSHNGFETPILAYYLTDVAYTAISARGGARILTDTGNKFGNGCGVVG